jgi:hypothetical protein
MFDVPPHWLRDRSRVTPPEMESGWEFQTFCTYTYTMPVSVDDKRQIWLRKHAPRPESINTVNANKLRVIMDTDNERFGQFYKILATVSSKATLRYYLLVLTSLVGLSGWNPLLVSILRKKVRPSREGPAGRELQGVLGSTSPYTGNEEGLYP